MKSLIEEVLLLQGAFSHINTPDMQRRGVLVRQEMRAWLETNRAALETAIGPGISDLAIEGRDGTGRKTEIPWIRLYSASRSPAATEGFYVVYLFSAEGDRCYLALGHGSTKWDGIDFKPRAPEELRALVEWARAKVNAIAVPHDRLLQAINLQSRRTNLGPSYEAGTAFAIEYELNAIPNDEVLLSDLQYMLGLLRAIYEGQDSDPLIPGSDPPEISIIEELASEMAGKSTTSHGRQKGQGFRLGKQEQIAVELRAVFLALEHYRDLGWQVKDVGARESYDLHAEKDGVTLYIEVKGTTALGEYVLLTRNEVELNRRHYPNTALFLVHSIELDRAAAPPTANGGVAVAISPWSIDDNELTPLAYSLRVFRDRRTDEAAGSA